MKPTKNRIHCNNSGKVRMLFETEKKANLFIKFNSEEIESESGYSPVRAYFCISCNGWHVTSREDRQNRASETEQFLSLFTDERKKQLVERECNIAEREQEKEFETDVEELKKIYKKIDFGIKTLEIIMERLSYDFETLATLCDYVEYMEKTGIDAMLLRDINKTLNRFGKEIKSIGYNIWTQIYKENDA